MSEISVIHDDPLAGTGLEITPAEMQAFGGLEAGSRVSRELASWQPALHSPDATINLVKDIVDARARDFVGNDGYALGAMAVHKDSVVGSQFKLNLNPNYRILGLDEVWADEFQQEVEELFTLYAESLNNWSDASRINSFTNLIRLGIGVHFMSGEIVASAEWINNGRRPYRTAIQMIEADRLCNPNNEEDSKTLRKGVERNAYGEPVAYHFRTGYETDPYVDGEQYTWIRIPAETRFGRKRIIHVHEQVRPDQSRGIAEMVAVLKQMRMTQRFQDVSLQQAVLQATYAATIESELPPESAYQQLGQGGTTDWAKSFLTQVAAYSGSARNLQIDGVKIPHLYPGTKFKLLNAGAPTGVGETFEQSLLRHTAAGLGLSYEEFSHDYTKTNYSSARAANNNTDKYMKSKKKSVADRYASNIFLLWFEEALNRGDFTTVTRRMPNFYEKMNREAYTRCTWIGSSRGQIDELKETQAAVLRVEAGLSTYEQELARGGQDFREVFAQRKREKDLMEKLGITPEKQKMIAGQGAHAGKSKEEPEETPADDGADDEQ